MPSSRMGVTLGASLPGLTPQVGFTRLAAHNTAQLGQARVAMQSIHFRKELLSKTMDARVISAFTRVFDALLPAHDASATMRCYARARRSTLAMRSGTPNSRRQTSAS